MTVTYDIDSALLQKIAARVPNVKYVDIVDWYNSAVDCGQPTTAEEFVEWSHYDDQGIRHEKPVL